MLSTAFVSKRPAPRHGLSHRPPQPLRLLAQAPTTCQGVYGGAAGGGARNTLPPFSIIYFLLSSFVELRSAVVRVMQDMTGVVARGLVGYSCLFPAALHTARWSCGRAELLLSFRISSWGRGKWKRIKP